MGTTTVRLLSLTDKFTGKMYVCTTNNTVLFGCIQRVVTDNRLMISTVHGCRLLPAIDT